MTEIKEAINLKGNQPWILTGRIDAEAEAPVFWSPDANTQLTRKVPDAGKTESRRRGCQRMRWLDGVTDAIDTKLGELWEVVRGRQAPHGVLQSLGLHRVAQNWATEHQQQNSLLQKNELHKIKLHIVYEV